MAANHRTALGQAHYLSTIYRGKRRKSEQNRQSLQVTLSFNLHVIWMANCSLALQTIADDIVSSACSCIATTPTFTATVGASTTLTVSVTNTATATSTSIAATSVETDVNTDTTTFDVTTTVRFHQWF